MSTMKNVEGTVPVEKCLLWQNASVFRAYDIYFEYGKVYMGEMAHNLRHSFFPSRRVYKPVKFEEIRQPFDGVGECKSVVDQLNLWVDDFNIQVTVVFLPVTLVSS